MGPRPQLSGFRSIPELTFDGTDLITFIYFFQAETNPAGRVMKLQ